MKEEIKSMHENDVWDLVQLLEGLKLLVVNAYLKPRKIHKVIQKDIRHVLLQRDLLNVKASIIMKPFLQNHQKIYSES